MKSLRHFFLLALLLLSVSMTSAQPPFELGGQFSEGYEIKVPLIENIPINQDLVLSFHVYNISNGVPIDNSSTNCFFHLYDGSGGHLLEKKISHINSNVNNEWELVVKGGNFSYRGQSYYNVQCNSTISNLGGRETVYLTISTKGYSLEIAEMILYLTVLGVFLFFFFLSIYGAIKIPYQNQKNLKGEVVSVNWKKHFKIFCILSTYYMILSIDWLIWNLVYAYSEWFELSNVFHYIYRFMHSLALPAFIFFILWSTIKLLDDKKISAFIKRTGLPYKPI